jgi:hypothetical protein
VRVAIVDCFTRGESTRRSKTIRLNEEREPICDRRVDTPKPESSNSQRALHCFSFATRVQRVKEDVVRRLEQSEPASSSSASPVRRRAVRTTRGTSPHRDFSLIKPKARGDFTW